VVDAVHAVEDGLLLVVDRRRDDDGLGAVVEKGLEGSAGEELAGALEDEVNAFEGDLGGRRKEEKKEGLRSSGGGREIKRDRGRGGARESKKFRPPTSAGVFALVNLKVDSFSPAVLIEKESPSSATVVLPNLPIVESNSSR